HLQADRPVFADGEVAYVGEPIAVVIAASRSLAEDAVEAVAIDFEPLPPVVDCREALRPDSPSTHSPFAHHRLADLGFPYGDIEAAFAGACHRVRESYKVHRGGSHSMEGRGVLAVPDRLSDKLNVWSSTQTPQALKQMLCDLLGLDEDEIAVFTPDV